MQKEIVTASELIAAVRSHGSDADDLRDAAHEACHALQWDVDGKWSRERIHRFKPRVRSDGVADEIMARAVEQIVCRQLGVECGDVEKLAFVCWKEMLKNERISLPNGTWLADKICAAMGTDQAAVLVARVISIGS